MNNIKELKLNICDRELIVFLSDSFSLLSSPSPFHQHSYAEVHLTLKGSCVICTETQELDSVAGDVTIIPREVSHRLKIDTDTSSHGTFSIQCSCPSDVLRYHVPVGVLEELVLDIREAERTSDYGKAALSLAYICKSVCAPHIKLSNIDSREFIIREFFANRYTEQITLSDLSRELMLSSKQSARLVEKYMGTSFSRVLAKHRMDAAKSLLRTDKTLTLSEIAAAVGYNSYSGFWKAFRACGSK